MADYDYIVDTGVVVPDVAAIQAEVENEYTEAFGADLNLSPFTPQGLLITAEVLARIAIIRNNAALANQINPNLAGGVFLDAIWGFTGGERPPATASRIPSVEISGVPGTIVTSALVLSNGDLEGPFFSPIETVTIGPDGTTFVDCDCLTTGPIQLAPDQLTVIVNGILGVETVNNDEAAIPGTAVLSDEQTRLMRKNSLALQASSLAEAVTSQLTMTPLVQSSSLRENVTSSIMVIDGITMLPHSIFVCVNGGDDTDVATAIAQRKGGGCGYSDGSPTAGGTPVTENITDPASGQTIPVTFVRPDQILILVRVTVKVTEAVGNPVDQVKQAVLDYANGLVDGEPGFVIGAPVSCFEIAGAINKEIPQLFIKKVETSLNTGPPVYSTDEIPIALWEVAYTTNGAIVVDVV